MDTSNQGIGATTVLGTQQRSVTRDSPEPSGTDVRIVKMGTPSHRRMADHLIPLAIAASGLYWILESAMDAFVFRKGDFLERLLAPDPNETWMRLLVACLIVVMAAISQTLINERRSKELRQTLDQTQARVQERSAELSKANQALRTESAERRRAEEALRRADQLETLGILAAGIAHDLSGLVAIITRQLESARTALPQDAASLRHLDTARQAAQQTSGMTQALQAVARCTPSEKHIVVLNDVCRNAAKLLRHLIGEAVIQVWDITQEPLHVLANPTQILQVLMNLLANARDAMPVGGTVRVSLSVVDLQKNPSTITPRAAAGWYARLDVADSGTGMTEEIKKQIFEPLFTTRHTERKGPTHAGLGLAIVQRIVEDHYGWIEIASEVETGSTFSVFFPCRDAGDGIESETDAEQASVPPGSGVLVVDQNDLQRSVVATALRDVGFKVQQARSAAGALSVIRDKAASIHVVVAAAELLDMTGAECLARIQDISRDVAGLLITATHQDASLATDSQRPQFQTLCQPFLTGDLTRSVTRLLKERSST
ncbi:MAG: ATP-binding protein [Phycisphaerae bacterium]